MSIETPKFFFDDMVAAGWIPECPDFLDDSRIFYRLVGDRHLVSFAQFTTKSNGFNQWRLNPFAKTGPAWFANTFQKVAEYEIFLGCFHSYKHDQWNGELNYIDSASYSGDWIAKCSQDLVDWAASVNIRHALEISACLRGTFENPPNSYTYVVALALLNKRSTLLELKDVATDPDFEDRRLTGAGKLTLAHVERALECCDHPDKYGVPQSALDEIRG